MANTSYNSYPYDPNGISPDNPFKGFYNGGFSDRTYNDEWYWQAIQQYKGSSFYDALLSNPYLVSNNDAYQPTLLGRVAQFMGDYSAEHAYYQDLRSKANQYLSQQVEAMRQQEYDSPSAQTERMKAAGLNPDLNGGSGISSGQAAENDQPMTDMPPIPSGQDPISVATTIGSFIVKAYSFASGIAKDGYTLANMALTNTGKETEVVDSIGKVAEDFLRDRITTPHKDDDGNWVFPDLANDSLDKYANEMFKTARSRKLFKSEVTKRYNSARSFATRWTDISNAEDARFRMVTSIGRNQAYGSDGRGQGNDVMINLSDDLNSMYLRLNKIQTTASIHENEYKDKYFEGMDANAAAAAANAQNKSVTESYDAQTYSREVDKIVNQTISKIISDLSDSAHGSGVEAAISKGMLLLFSAYRSNLIPELPKINFGGSK